MQPASGSPSFGVSYFSAYILSTAGIGTAITMEHPNGALTTADASIPYPSIHNPAVYNLTLSNSSSASSLPFTLNTSASPTGAPVLIVLSRTIDVKSMPLFYDTVLIVTLQGYPELSTSCHIAITVVDVTTGTPKFASSLFTFNMADDATLGSSIGALRLNTTGASALPVGLAATLGAEVVFLMSENAQSDLPVYVLFSTGDVVVRSVINSTLLGTSFLFNVTATNGILNATTTVKVDVTQGQNCAGITCVKPCYVGGHCVQGTCVFSGLTNGSMSCIESALACSCPANTDGGLVWPMALCGDLFVQPCSSDANGLAQRACLAGGVWSTANFSACVSPKIQNLLAVAATANATSLLEQLANVTVGSNALGVVDLLSSISILDAAARTVAADPSSLSGAAAEAFANSVNNVLSIPSTIAAASNTASSSLPGFCVATVAITPWMGGTKVSNADQLTLLSALQAVLGNDLSSITILSTSVASLSLTMQFQGSTTAFNSAAALALMSASVANGTLITALRARNVALFASSSLSIQVPPIFRYLPLASAMGTFVQAVSQTMSSGASLVLSKPNVNIALFNVNCGLTGICDFLWSVDGTSVIFPPSILASVANDTTVSVVTYIDSQLFYDDSLSSKNMTVGSSVVAVDVLYGLNKNHLPAPFNFTLPATTNFSLNAPLCSYYDLGFSDTWLTDGCMLISSSTTQFTCSCTHMTNFAVLTSLQGSSASVTSNSVLTYITYIGMAISIPCLVITVVILLVLRRLINLHRFIIANLSACLAAVLFIFTFGIDATSSPACLGLALSMHYFLLAAFCWLLLDGIALFTSFTNVFSVTAGARDYVLRAFFAYGIPGVVVGVTYALAHDSYLNSNNCWISGST